MATAAPEVPSLVRDQAFEALYRRYVTDVYHYALALLRNPADAEDVTQTTFMNAYRAFKRGEHIEKPHNWLIKIAHNAVRTRYARASRRAGEVPLDEHLEQLAVPEAERPDVQAVLDALGRLPLNQRAALVMRELEGRSYAEIADTLGVSIAAVETLIFRARRALRLKASSIRVLGVIPVPGTLSQLLGTGGVAAGGGAIVGSGFVLKAAVAIVAGVVATGINSDHPSGADAAPPHATAHASIAATKSARAAGNNAAGRIRTIARRPRSYGRGAGVSGASVRTDDDAPVAASVVSAPQSGRAETGAPAAASPSSSVQGPAAPAAATVETATAPVQAAAATVGSASSALPVQSPLPVAVPSLPPAPQLPKLP